MQKSLGSYKFYAMFQGCCESPAKSPSIQMMGVMNLRAFLQVCQKRANRLEYPIEAISTIKDYYKILVQNKIIRANTHQKKISFDKKQRCLQICLKQKEKILQQIKQNMFLNAVEKEPRTYEAVLCDSCKIIKKDKCFRCSTQSVAKQDFKANICVCCVSSKKLKCTKCTKSILNQYHKVYYCTQCKLKYGQCCAKCGENFKHFIPKIIQIVK